MIQLFNGNKITQKRKPSKKNSKLKPWKTCDGKKPMHAFEVN